LDESTVLQLTPITVLVRIDIIRDKKEFMPLPGLLTSENFAMYWEHHLDEFHLRFSRVKTTDDPNVYRVRGSYTLIGCITEDELPDKVIHALVGKLHQMTGYDFMEQVVSKLRCEADFEDWIMPVLLKGRTK
jgi:hypothetical protein